MNAKELSVILEAAIDQHDLCGVLGLIENICYIKAERTMADLLDEDFEALNKVLEIFSNQFSAKFEGEGNDKATKKVAKKKK